MDSLGKIFDFLVMLVVLFIFPVSWAFGRAETVGDYSLKEKTENFLDSCLTTRQIEGKGINGLISGLDDLFKHYEVELSVKRRIAEAEADGTGYHTVSYSSMIDMPAIEDDIEKKGYFALYKKDVLIIKIYDEKGVFISGARLII